MEERKVLRASGWSKLGSVFGFILSGLLGLLTVVLATPFFLLSLLFNWIKAGIGLTLFWIIAYAVYDSFVLQNSSISLDPFANEWTVVAILAVSFIVALIATINGD
ncbi:hypothetical protein [Streptococcus sp. zg-JUN1979]|uniref:hypothetical protein n=1 Tax=Streptococcus sp. zg-JUN1979 TaxID=3391450 RepID=UPI0039AF9EAB